MRLRVAVGRGVEAALMGSLIVGANYFANWRMSPSELAVVVGGWAGLWLLPGLVFRRPRFVWLAEAAAAGLYWWLAGRLMLAHPLPGAVLRSGAVGLMVVVAGWRWLGWRAAVRSGVDSLAEQARWLAVIFAVLWVMLPLITDNVAGGTDAKWYAIALRDFIEQWRAGGPPVFLGQGEFAWNGAVHPFRSAPVYMYVAGVWDWLTGGTLPVYSLQHLSAVSAGLAGGFVVYLGGVGLLGGRRWTAVLISVLYVWAPAGLMAMYAAEAYMTYAACGALALVFSGNARLMREGRGAVSLAAGLALAWMCHPPTAMLATMATGALQLAVLAFGPCDRAAWRQALLAGLLFAVLAAYYFAGMAELPLYPGRRSLEDDALQLAGLALGWFGLAQWVVMKRSRAWAWLVALGGGLLGLISPGWLVWLVLTAGLLLAVCALARRWRWFEPADWGPLLLWWAAALAAAVADWAVRAQVAFMPRYPGVSQLWLDAWSGRYFDPLPAALNTSGALQPGWGLWLAVAALGWAGARAGAWRAQAWLAVTAGLSVLLLRWPGVSVWAVEFFPPDLRDVAGATMPLRTMPVFCALLTGGLLLGLGERVWWVRAWSVVLALAVAWAGSESWLFVRHGLRVVGSSADTQRLGQSENTPFDRFFYDLLPTPGYYSHGKFDPAVEMRLRDSRGGLRFGPADLVRAMEEAGCERHRLVAQSFGAEARWLRLEPGVTVEPGERRLLRFEFDEGKNYDGYLILAGTRSYREYILPESGLPEAFGVKPGNARHLVLWNTGSAPEHYEFRVLRGAANDLVAGDLFAKLSVSRYEPKRAAVELSSYVPLRLRTRFAEGGWLETIRVALPGYEVRLDGALLGPGQVGRSRDGLLQVQVPAGEHEIEVRYAGTRLLWLAGGVSLAGWIGVVGYGLLRPGRRRAQATG